MGLLDKETDENAANEVTLRDHPQASSLRPLPCNDATGHVLPITPEEQARDARAIAILVERMLAMPDEDPLGYGKKPCETSTPSAPTANFSRVSINHSAADPAGQRAARPDLIVRDPSNHERVQSSRESVSFDEVIPRL
jgi:hypothetical protein